MKYELSAIRLREAMNDIGISQQELANKSGIGKSSISHYINGSNQPGNKSAFLLGKVLGVSPTWLMGLDVPKKENVDISDRDMDKAWELYQRYINLPPEFRKAADALLKIDQADT